MRSEKHGALHRNEVYAGGAHLATYMNGTTYFTYADWLGTERVRSTVAGGIYSTWTSFPFGEGSLAPNPSPLHFTGKERDAESGNDYFGARYYGSSMGRFLSPDWSASPDPVPYADISNPQTLNLYGYGNNNPLTNTDPDGHYVNVCDANGQNCHTIWDDQAYSNAQQQDTQLNGPSLSQLQQSGGSMNITDSNGNVVGTAQWGPNNSGIDGPANAAAFGQIGNQGMGAINFFMTNMALSAAGETALNGVRLGAEALVAARAAKAADAAAQATSQSWKFGAFKSATKWANQLLKRGWTESEITDTIANGERYPAVNNINPANGATRYVSPTTGKSVVVDNVTNEVLHVGGSGFQY